MPWYRKLFTDVEIKERFPSRVLGLFEATFARLGKPPDVAMFQSAEANGALTAYFSPATEQQAPDFLRTVGAEPTPRPTDIHVCVVGAPGVLGRYKRGEF